jgi:hypothetical protein
MALKLIVEKPDPQNDFEYIVEEKDRNSPSTLYIKGPYMMAEGVNRNNRLYPIDEMVREVSRYTEEMIVTQRAMGELNHPTSAEVNPERACHIVNEITRDGNVFYGKSKVLNTPMGNLVKSLINDGVKLGMSSRSLGQLVENNGKNVVKDMRLVAIDCVADPSYPKAFVNGILESKQYVLNQDGSLGEYYENFEKKISNLPRKDVDQFLRESVIDFINKLKLS